jgi:hypothetical protein
MALPFFESRNGFFGQGFAGQRRNPQIFQPETGFYVVVGHDSYLRSIHLYPIPFDAASGISDWKGCAMTAGMGTLGKDLKAIKAELSQLNRYTFDSDLWDGVTDVKDLIYSMEMVKPSYIGLTEAPPNNIMPGG